jgi:diadenosine tetraphosphate (Ap4A) HIT family hydrolase
MPEEIATRLPNCVGWEAFPFTGSLKPKSLLPSVLPEPPREGEEGGGECKACAALDSSYIWVDEHWRLTGLREPTGSPFVGVLEPRPHLDLEGLDDEWARLMGLALHRVERAVATLPDVGRIHLMRFGDGRAHLHWWIVGRPAGVLQMRGNFSIIWDQMIPALPQEKWHANRHHVATALALEGGRCLTQDGDCG